MIDYKSVPEIMTILAKFSSPELYFIRRKDAGPDEELYFFRDNNNKNYCIWSRDYMSELKYEANGLKNEFDITVKKWIKLKESNEFVAEYNGDYYALAMIEEK